MREILQKAFSFHKTKIRNLPLPKFPKIVEEFEKPGNYLACGRDRPD